MHIRVILNSMEIKLLLSYLKTLTLKTLNKDLLYIKGWFLEEYTRNIGFGEIKVGEQAHIYR